MTGEFEEEVDEGENEDYDIIQQELSKLMEEAEINMIKENDEYDDDENQEEDISDEEEDEEELGNLLLITEELDQVESKFLT